MRGLKGGGGALYAEAAGGLRVRTRMGSGRASGCSSLRVEDFVLLRGFPSFLSTVFGFFFLGRLVALKGKPAG